MTLKQNEQIMILDELSAGEEGEWIASLSIVCADLAQADRAFAKLSATALDLSHDSVSQMVSKHSYGDDEDYTSTSGENMKHILMVEGAWSEKIDLPVDVNGQPFIARIGEIIMRGGNMYRVTNVSWDYDAETVYVIVVKEPAF